MAKTSQLDTLSSVDVADILAVSDISAGQSKKITVLNFIRSVVGGVQSRNIDIKVADATARDALTPVAGMIVFQDDNKMLQIYNGSEWCNIPRLLKRVALTSTGTTITVSSIPARDAYTAKILLKPTGGTMYGALRFNNDTGTKYAQNSSNGGGAYGTAASGTAVSLFAAAEAYAQKTQIEITNESGLFKIGDVKSQDMFGADASTTSNFYDSRIKYADTALINRMDIVKAGGTGSFASGSYAEIYG